MMKTTRKLAVMLLVCLSHLAVAQETEMVPVKERRLTFGMGYSNLRMLDRQVTPLIYRSHMVPLYFGYSSKTEDRFLNFDFSLTAGVNRSRNFKTRQALRNVVDNEGILEKEEVDMNGFIILQQEINIEYFTRIGRSRERAIQYYLGAALKEQFSLSFTTLANFVWHEISLSPAFLVKYELDRSTRLSASMSVPLTGLMIRLPYANDPSDGKHSNFISVYTMGTKVFSPADYQRVNLHLSYEKTLSENWFMGIEYGFYWFHYSQNRSITAYDNSLMIKFSKLLKSK